MPAESKYRASFLEGQAAERRFQAIMDRRGCKCVFREDKQSQFVDHVDFEVVTKDGALSLVDVKGMKRGSRSDCSTSPDKIWLEFRNVNGNLGWIYGKADFVAFETHEGFVFIPREDLKNWAERNVDLAHLVYNSWDAYKKGYMRRGRNDLISLVNMSDIEHLIAFKIPENP
jgi:hypothetical protein